MIVLNLFPWRRKARCKCREWGEVQSARAGHVSLCNAVAEAAVGGGGLTATYICGATLLNCSPIVEQLSHLFKAQTSVCIV